MFDHGLTCSKVFTYTFLWGGHTKSCHDTKVSYHTTTSPQASSNKQHGTKLPVGDLYQ
jgi:hypothetical protein